MIGTYYRLSLADEDVGADKAESNSIQGQRGLVEGYIVARPELAAEPRQEYVDDGYSGTSTSRPAFQRLIQDAQDGKVKTIIVKDFSRFARDYIEAGDYMERIFPLLGVRFISVSDGYDSGMQAGNDVRGLEVAIKNIINASYSRDLSAKIAAADHVMQKKGMYLEGYRPFLLLSSRHIVAAFTPLHSHKRRNRSTAQSFLMGFHQLVLVRSHCINKFTLLRCCMVIICFKAFAYAK